MHCQYITEVWRRSDAGDLISTLAIDNRTNHGDYYYRDYYKSVLQRFVHNCCNVISLVILKTVGQVRG